MLGRKLGRGYRQNEITWPWKGTIQLKDRGYMARETVRLQEDTGGEENMSFDCII